MKVLGVIPSRFESSRFPGKPLIDLKGKTMIQRVYESCSACGLFEQLIVATDDERIFNHVRSFGGEVMMTSKNHKSGTDRCAEVLNKTTGKIDVVVNIQGDEPLVKCQQLASIIDAFKEEKVLIATLAKKGLSNESAKDRNRVKVVCDLDNNALYFSRSPIPFQQDDPASYIKHIGLYAFRPETLLEVTLLKQGKLEIIESLEQLRWMENGYKIKVVFTYLETPNIDVPKDVDKVLPFIS